MLLIYVIGVVVNLLWLLANPVETNDCETTFMRRHGDAIASVLLAIVWPLFGVLLAYVLVCKRNADK